MYVCGVPADVGRMCVDVVAEEPLVHLSRTQQYGLPLSVLPHSGEGSGEVFLYVRQLGQEGLHDFLRGRQHAQDLKQMWV